jgi:hypothetical protein
MVDALDHSPSPRPTQVDLSSNCLHLTHYLCWHSSPDRRSGDVEIGDKECPCGGEGLYWVYFLDTFTSICFGPRYEEGRDMGCK